MADDDLLYRLIIATNTKWNGDHAARAGSNAFDDVPEDRLAELGAPAVAVSVYIDSVMRQHGATLDDLLDRWGPKYGIAALRVSDARECHQGIVRDPRPEAPEHGMIFALEGPRKTRQQSRALAKASWIAKPPPRR